MATIKLGLKRGIWDYFVPGDTVRLVEQYRYNLEFARYFGQPMVVTKTCNGLVYTDEMGPRHADRFGLCAANGQIIEIPYNEG